jgi:hypothetical protein
VDLFHAREHVHDLANLAGRLLAGHRDEWLAARLAELDAGDIPALIAAGQNLKFTGSLASDRDKALHYFETNAHRMRYAWYRSLGLFVGSGVVEAGCRAVPEGHTSITSTAPHPKITILYIATSISVRGTQSSA